MTAAMQQQAQEVTGFQQVEEEEQYGPLLVRVLEQHGIAANDCKKLQEAGFYTVESVVYAPRFVMIYSVKGVVKRFMKEEVD